MVGEGWVGDVRRRRGEGGGWCGGGFKGSECCFCMIGQGAAVAQLCGEAAAAGGGGGRRRRRRRRAVDLKVLEVLFVETGTALRALGWFLRV